MEPNKLNELIGKLKEINQEFIQSGARFITAGDGKLHTMDLFALAVNNRAFSLVNGFVSLAIENNYSSAVPLIRIQIDNALRFFASTLVSDYDEFFLKYLNGIAIGNIEDYQGKQMKDNYLARLLNKHFKGILELYKYYSGHIHLSNEHFSIMSKIVNPDSKKIEIKVGDFDFFDAQQKIDFVKHMLDASRVVLIVVEQWRFQKDQMYKFPTNKS